MAPSLTKRIKQAWLRRISRGMLEAEFSRRLIESLPPAGGEFLDGRDYAGKQVNGVPSESGIIVGEIVHLLQTLARPSDSLLLLGERNAAKPAYAKAAGIAQSNIRTAGLHAEMDYLWDYEKAVPQDLPRSNLIASQAMLEHLVDPYKHMRECFELLEPGGYLIVHSVMPGFHYHRYPIDCLRFYPDWFEALAARAGVQVHTRMISTMSFIVYCFRSPAL